MQKRGDVLYMHCILTQYGNQLHAGSGLELSGLEAAIKPFGLLFLKNGEDSLVFYTTDVTAVLGSNTASFADKKERKLENTV